MVVHDELENNWGTQVFLNEPIRTPNKSMVQFDALVRQSVKGFKLFKVQSAGTYANMIAVEDATEYNIDSALYAVGSYVGGDQYLQDISTTAYDVTCSISTPKFVEIASDRCFAQAVPMPYYVPGGIRKDALLKLEEDCLRCFHRMLIFRRMSGQKPFRALVLELLLGGNGTVLSDRFLEKLGTLCYHNSIAIIVDEILTGGRNGNKMVMTLSTPAAFQAAVKYITMGKFIGCAMVLKKIPKKPTAMEERLRGTSTTLECGKAFALWQMVVAAVSRGDIKKRRQEVVKCFKMSDDQHWGEGCLIFSVFKRPKTMTALKCRMLPMFDLGLKIVKQSAHKSKYTRLFVTEEVTSIMREWIVAKNVRFESQLQTCFASPLVDMLFQNGHRRLEGAQSEERGYFKLRAEEVVDYIGRKKSEQLAKGCREQKIRDGATTCKMKPLQFVRQALLLAGKQKLENGDPIVYKKKKTSARKEFVFVNATLFGVIARQGRLTYHS